jgi:hypothetical protein
MKLNSLLERLESSVRCRPYSAMDAVFAEFPSHQGRDVWFGLRSGEKRHANR